MTESTETREVRAYSSAWVLERAAHRECEVFPSRAPYLASRYPQVYAADFVRGFLAAVPALVIERAMMNIVIVNYVKSRVYNPLLAMSALSREWPPRTRAAAVLVLAAWARVEGRSYDEVCRSAADAFLALHRIDRDKPVDVPPGFDPDVNESFRRTGQAFRDLGDAFNGSNSSHTVYTDKLGKRYLRFE